MSDHTTRSLERHASRTGDASDRVALLRARLRAGDPCGECGGAGYRRMVPGRDPYGHHTPCTACAGTGLLWLPRVQLAAYVGDEAARAALGWPLTDDSPRLGYPLLGPAYPPVVGSTNDLGIWARGLSRFGREACVRAAVAGGRAALRECRRCKGTLRMADPDRVAEVQRGQWDHRTAALALSSGLWTVPCADCAAPRRALEAAEDWVACPCERHGEACSGDHHMGVAAVAPFTGPMLTAAWVASMPHAGDHTGHVASCMTDCLERCARLVGEQAVRAAVLNEVAPWALLERDVVRERVEARRR